MKMFAFTIALLILGVKSAQAEHSETYAFGDTEADACEKVKSELNDQAILKCRMNGAWLDKADYSECRTTKSAENRYKAENSLEFSCKTH